MKHISKKKGNTHELVCCLKTNTVKAWQCSTDNYFTGDIPDWVLETCSIRYDKTRERLIAYREPLNGQTRVRIFDGEWIIQDIDGSIKVYPNSLFEISFDRVNSIRKRGLFNGAS